MMAATSGFTVSLAAPPPPAHNYYNPHAKPVAFSSSNYGCVWSKLSTHQHHQRIRTVGASSSAAAETETPVVEEEQGQETETTLSSEDDLSGSLPSLSESLTGCQACGRTEIENGCNGEGRIQGGIATVPGFGWWPIKAYRPCPAFVASGGRYRRTGQSMDEVVSGRGGASNEAQSSKKKEGPRRFKS